MFRTDDAEIRLRLNAQLDQRRYNLPTSNEVAVTNAFCCDPST